MERSSEWEISGERVRHMFTLRLVMALIVLYSHCFPLEMGKEGVHIAPFYQFVHGQVTIGRLVVDAFFVLSGFLITRSWLTRTDTKDYIKRRILRIYPGYLAMWVFCILVVVPLAQQSFVSIGNVGEMLRHILRALLLWEPGVAGTFASNPFPNSINGSLWTLKYEVGFYIAVALLGTLGLLTKRGVVLGLLVAFYLLQVLALLRVLPFPSHEMQISYLLLGNVPVWIRLTTFFLGGAVFYLYRERIPRSPLWCGIALFLLLIVANYLHILEVVEPLLVPYIVLCFAFSPNRLFVRLGAHGDFSYAAYLYAFPIQQLLVQYFGSVLNPYTLFLTATPLTLLCSVLSWRLIESHFSRPRTEKKTEVEVVEANSKKAGPLEVQGTGS